MVSTKEKKTKIPHARSYSSIYDILGISPYFCNSETNCKNIPTTLRQGFEKHNSDSTLNKRDSEKYITSEKYYYINLLKEVDKNDSKESIIFCDLDNLVKKKSFEQFAEVHLSNSYQIKNYRRMKKRKNIRKINTIIQECGTKVKPHFKTCGHKLPNSKKLMYYQDAFSSEILLKDNKEPLFYVYHDRGGATGISIIKSKCHLECNGYPQTDDLKQKDKRNEQKIRNPCPCQLFSYACPCTDEKSFTDIKEHKSISLVDHSTSTRDFVKYRKGKPKSNKVTKEKLTNTTFEKCLKHEVGVCKIENEENIEIKPIVDSKQIYSSHNYGKKNKKRKKKVRSIVCPNCKEKLELDSNTDDENVLKYNSFIFGSNELATNEPYAFKVDDNVSIENEKVCNHDPKCEMVPVCQILPNDNVSKITKYSGVKPGPRMIKITKACRHHPPCTVVPSCQRANVLKNNCEFIPPCLHHPRCVNLPLCVPFCKNVYYDEPPKDDAENKQNDVNHNYSPICEHVQLSDKNKEKHYNNLDPYCVMSTVPTAPSHSIYLEPRKVFSNKSCQYYSEVIVNPVAIPVKEFESDAVIFIRDVGCQFREKKQLPNVQYKTSSSSFDNNNVVDNIGNYYTDIRTLRYEDKYTNPILPLMDSGFSIEINSACQTQGCRQTGFKPRVNTTALVAQLSTYTDPVMTSYINFMNKRKHRISKAQHRYDHNTFLKPRWTTWSRHENLEKRRRKSRNNNHFCKSLKKTVAQI